MEGESQYPGELKDSLNWNPSTCLHGSTSWRAEILIAGDVTQPLVWAPVASYVYGPQKGRNPERCCRLWIRLWPTWPGAIRRDLDLEVAELKGGQCGREIKRQLVVCRWRGEALSGA